ncbi:MAG TPA: hypothetical protein VHZ30_06955, partial [Verrucomicrobiae bacterium]|nr:hypothetical protein [Verrucomicrobiae bacterium]
NPGQGFTFGVLAALPISATSAKALSLGAALKGSSTFKTFATIAAVGAVILYYSLLGFLAFAGACTGYWMSRASAGSVKQCENVIRFWRTLVWGYAICFITRQLLFSSVGFFNPSHHILGMFSSWFLMRVCVDLFYVVIVGTLAIWMRRWWRDFSTQHVDPKDFPFALKRRFALWLSLGVIVPVCWFVPIIGGFLWQTFGPVTVRHLSDTEVQKIIKEDKSAFYYVMETEDGSKILHVNTHRRSDDPGGDPIPNWWKHWVAGTKPAWWNLWIGSAEPRLFIELVSWTGWRPGQLLAAADESNLGLLKEMGIHYGTGTFRSGYRDAWPFGSLVPYFLAPMGLVIVLRRIGKRNMLPGENDYEKTLLAIRDDPWSEKVFRIVFATTFLLVFIAHAFTATGGFAPMGLYFVFFLGSIKGAFFGLLTAVSMLYFRAHRRTTETGQKI